jgi:hypothetical protein
MESILASTEDHLVSNLQFKIPSNSGASYVTSKSQVTYFSQGSNIYSPTTGQRILRFALASDGYIDLSSLAVSVDLAMGPIGVATPLVAGGHSLFSRMRWTLSGTTVEDIEYFNTCSEMFHRLLPAEAKSNIELMAFGGNTIQPGSTKNLVTMPKISGLCNQPLWLAGSFLGSQGAILELHLADGDEIFQSGAGQNTTYQLSNCRVLCDVYHISNELANTYANHVLSGRPLVYPIKSLVNTQFQLQSGTPSFDLNVARSFSRLNSVFLVMHGATSGTVRDVNTFIGMNPEEVNGRLQIGSKQWPDGQNVQGMSQWWLRLISALGVVHSASHNIAITRTQYETNSFIAAWDTEKVPVATGSGFNCAKGELVTISMKGLSNSHQKALIMCHHDVIIELRDTGCDVLV